MSTLDIFSRYVVNLAMVADRENAQGARRRRLTRGNLSQARHRAPGAHPAVRTSFARSMTQQVHRPTPRRPRGHPLLMSVGPHGQRRHTPFCRWSQFKTLKYHPGFPGRFDRHYRRAERSRFCQVVRIPWYNTEHRFHAGIAMLTPDDVHHHRAPDVLAKRGRTLQRRLGPSPRNASSTGDALQITRPASRSRLDQPTRALPHTGETSQMK